MKTLTRLTSVFLAAVLLLCAMPPKVQAEEYATAEEAIIAAFSRENEALGTDIPVITDEGECVFKGGEVDISQFHISTEEIGTLYETIRNSGALPWYASIMYSYSYQEDTGLVETFIPLFLDTAVYDRTAYEQTVAEILDEALHPEMDQWQIALALHDYLVTHTVYDESLEKSTSYDLLVNGTAVCSGYAHAYQELLARVGIDSVIVSSDAMGDMGHCWNLVNLYGQWYHVDVTWDDPISDVYGLVSHKYFLVTDEEITGPEDHHGWQTDILCTDTTYQEGFWRDLDSAVNYTSSLQSFYRQDDPDTWTTGIYAREERTGEVTLLYTFEPEYFDLGDGTSYYYPQNGLTLWNGRLYVTTMDSVCSMTLTGEDVRTEFSYDVEGNSKYICGSFVKDGMIFLTLADGEYNKTPLVVPLDSAAYAPYHTHQYEKQVTAPTCTLGGFTTYLCQCSVTFTAQEVLPTGHSYDAGTVTREPTTELEGERTYTCSGCGDSYTEAIPPLEPEIPLSPEEEDGPPVAVFIAIGCAIVAIGAARKRKKK